MSLQKKRLQARDVVQQKNTENNMDGIFELQQISKENLNKKDSDTENRKKTLEIVLPHYIA